ncbi:MAG: hypothetical protein KJ649_02845, partial [Proteobacteria bacterium]|nr:hypothetical protein [Pseudomonadota bacterium]
NNPFHLAKQPTRRKGTFAFPRFTVIRARRNENSLDPPFPDHRLHNFSTAFKSKLAVAQGYDSGRDKAHAWNPTPQPQQ